MELTTVWFLAIAGLWIGYFVLEGFDFGVGMLLRVLGRDEPERRAVITTIGPVWDGNEVWLIVAGGGDVRGLPGVVRDAVQRVLPAAVRDPGGADPARGRAGVPRQARRPGVARPDGHDDHDRVGACPRCCGGSPSPTWSAGCRWTRRYEYVGSLGDLLSPFALLGGVTFTAVFVAHGAIFLALRTTDDLRRARQPAGLAEPVVVAAVLAVAFLCVGSGDPWRHRLGDRRGRRGGRVRRRSGGEPVRPRGLGLHRYGARDRAGRGVVVRRDVPGRDAVNT